MMIGNTEAPAGAATPIAGAGNNPYTDCITIPLEEYKKTLEMATELGIIRELAGDQNVYLILAKSQPDSMVPMAEYESLQNTMAIRIKHLEDELKTKTSIIESLTNSQTAGHICPVCERVFYEEPAISRRDPDLKICSVCATTEALEDAQAAGAMSKGEANAVMEVVKEVSDKKEDEEVVPRQSTPEQCSKGGRKTQQGKKIDLPMEEIMELKAKGWSNVRIAGRYGVTDVTIGTRIKQYLAKNKPAEKPAEPVQTDSKRPLDITDLRARRAAGETYEHIGRAYGGWTEDEVHAFIIQKGKEERGGQD